MTADRTPLAVLMTALGESLGIPSTAASQTSNTPQPAAPLLAQKKRKRTVSCGHCDACGREDCGQCLNCLDKPKFGGQGIRKQSCLERKCRFPTSATITSHTPAPAPSTSPSPAAEPASHSKNSSNKDMSSQEWDEFWGAVECCMRLQTSTILVPQATTTDSPANKKARTARCGTCIGCVRGDCGECKNCLDKPKFGGRGIKKQACLQRVCCNPTEVTEEDNENADRRRSVINSGFVSAEQSPRLLPEGEGQCVAPPPLALPTADSQCQQSARTKKVSFAVPDTEAYSTDDEEERAERHEEPPERPCQQPKQQALGDVSPSEINKERDAAAAGHTERGADEASQSDREAGAAEALVMASASIQLPASQLPLLSQLPLMLLLSASAAR